MKAKDRESYESMEYMALLALKKIQEDIETRVDEFFTRNLCIICLGFVLLFFLSLWIGGILLVGLKWMILSWPVIALIVTCWCALQAFRLFRKSRKSFLSVYKDMLGNCVLRDDLCPLKKYRWHRYKNFFAWYMAEWFGTPGLAVGYFLQRYFTFLIVPILLPFAIKRKFQIY